MTGKVSTASFVTFYVTAVVSLAEQVGDGAGALDDWAFSSSPPVRRPWATEENLPTALDEQ
jgi:hypothetical protein